MILVNNRNSADPYLNLALEEFLIRTLQCEEEDYLLLYINEPSIVIGKNQSIYKEVNFEFLRNGQLKLARRITGGGTVYHDNGNLNFSIISKFAESKVNNYRYFNQPVVDALGRAGVEAEMDTRNNIICKGKKISGSAQFTNRKKIISHGTLLLNADLNTLRAGLKENDFKVESKAVSSVKSSVMNLDEATDKFASTMALQQFLAGELSVTKKYELTTTDWAEVENLRDEKFKTFEWIYGRSPLTRIEKRDVVIEVEEGKIVSITSAIDLPNMVGEKYEYQNVKKALGGYPNASVLVAHIF
jgi:lipoate-protein ligase A